MPIRVTVPPSTVANAIGMRKREAGSNDRRARVTTAGSRSATAAALFMIAESMAAASMTRPISHISLPPPSRCRPRAISVATPLSWRAAPTTKMDPIVMTAWLPKPASAWVGSRITPVATRMTGIARAVTPMGSHFVTKSRAAPVSVAMAIHP